MITPEKLAEWEALAEKATPGPWQTGYHETKQYCGQNISTFEVGAENDMCWIAKVQEHRSCISTAQGNVNGEFIAASRTALPEAIAEIRRLQAESDKWFEAFERERKEHFKKPAFRTFVDLKHGVVGEILRLLQEGQISRGKAAEALAEVAHGVDPLVPEVDFHPIPGDITPSQLLAENARLQVELQRLQPQEAK